MKYALGVILCLSVVAGIFGETTDRLAAQETRQNQTDRPGLSPPPDEMAGKQEKSALAYAALKDISSNHYVDAMKTLGFLIVAIGWLITSPKTREYFGRLKSIRTLSIIAVAILGIIHIASCLDYYIRSQEMANLLEGLRYFDVEYFDQYRLETQQVVLNIVQNIALFALLIVLLCSSGKTAQKSS